MPELRKDYTLDRYVIIATERGKRPDQFAKERQSKEVKECYFCPGNENSTPPEIGRLANGDTWYIRWFANKFPAVRLDGNDELQTDNHFYTFASAFGKHEVIVESPNHEDDLADLSVEHLRDLLKVYRDRINSLNRLQGVRYVVVLKNHLSQAGTSIAHTHSQVISYNIVPKIIRDKIEAGRKYGGDPFEIIIPNEIKSERRIYENRHFVSFAPYASRFPMEAWIYPKKFACTLNDFDEVELYDLAGMLKKLLLKLKEINAPFNYYLHYAPEGEQLRFHIEICPRVATWAGFELGTETIINAVPPEDAAEFYRK